MKQFSYSRLSTFQSCPRKYYYKYVQKIECPQVISSAAEWSKTLIHPAITGLYNGKEPDWTALEYDYRTALGDATPGKAHTVARAQHAVETYRERFLKFDLEQGKVMMVEAPFYQTLQNANFVSIPDIVLRDKRTDELFIIELKASTNDSSSFYMLPWSNQLVSQAMCVDANWVYLTHLHCVKEDRCVITRTPIFISQDMKNIWNQETQQLIETIAQYEHHHVWPKNAPDACMKYGEPCPYSSQCGAGSLD